jgi:hypothetical protein
MRTVILLALLAMPQSVPEVPQGKAEGLHALIKPQAGEFAWYEEIPWLTGVQEAREKAAKEDKPIVVWCSADGQPCGAT